MTNLVSFNKYKAYLESQGYKLESKTVDFDDPVWIRQYFFSKSGEVDGYLVSVFNGSDRINYGQNVAVFSINYGHGTPFSGTWVRIKPDFRKKFWKLLKKD